MSSRRDVFWNRCDVCGRFVSMANLDSGVATRHMALPDSDFSAETYETLCRSHSPHTKAYRSKERARSKANAAILNSLFA